MKTRNLLRAAAIGLAATFSVAAVQGWMVTFAETDGGHRMGDPDAAVQLIEFVSYTCPHCAHFERDSEGALKLGYVHEGKVAVEIKHLIRDKVDLTVAMVARCGAADKFFGNHTALMLSQDEWFAKGRALSPAQMARWNSGTPAQQLQAIAGDLGLYERMQTRGYEATELDACLADIGEAQAIVDRSVRDAQAYGIDGTPSFVVNGTKLEGVHSWQSLNLKLAEFTTK